MVQQIFLVWEEPEVGLASCVWKVNLLLPVNYGSAGSCCANPDFERYPSCQQEKTDDLDEDGCQALGHLVFQVKNIHFKPKGRCICEITLLFQPVEHILCYDWCSSLLMFFNSLS